MAARKLAVTTVVNGNGYSEVDDSYLVLGPGDDVPAWAVDQIGDHCWADDDGDGDEADKPRRGRPAKPSEDK